MKNLDQEIQETEKKLAVLKAQKGNTPIDYLATMLIEAEFRNDNAGWVKNFYDTDHLICVDIGSNVTCMILDAESNEHCFQTFKIDNELVPNVTSWLDNLPSKLYTYKFTPKVVDWTAEEYIAYDVDPNLDPKSVNTDRMTVTIGWDVQRLN